MEGIQQRISISPVIMRFPFSVRHLVQLTYFYPFCGMIMVVCLFPSLVTDLFRTRFYCFTECSHISPCYAEYGQDESCGHKIGQPRNLTLLPGNHSQCPEQDTLVVQWYPSEYGILFLQGFIVELKSDSGYGVLSKCQQIVINKRGVLQNEDASMVFGTTFCVPLSTTYSIRVRAYPVPMGTEKDKDIFTKAMFTSRTCEEVYGAHHCKDWAPTNITIFGSDNTVSIEFDSAPDEYNIRYYLVYYRGFEEESWRMKMVVSSDLTDSPSKEVYYVFPETESVPKVVFIVAPLLVMVTGVALGFTIVFVSSAKKKGMFTAKKRRICIE
ncbi:I17RD protein, partial [Polypterus senegalus]|nr:I17RD protein [Polypterus senegalus]